MFRRILLAITFVAAFGAAGVGLSRTAEAHGCGHGRYYGGYRGGYSAFYAPYGRSFYAPRYRSFYRGYNPYSYPRRSGVYFSIGF